MRIVTTVIFLIWVAIASTPATELTGEQRAAAFVRAIQEATDQNDLDRKLKLIDPNLQDRSWVLPPLFASIASGHAKPETWTALCRVDRWGDGAWHLEMKAAAFDGFARNPQAFVDRYLSGDDCSLLLLLYAYRWTLEAADVGAVDCAAKGQEEFAQFDKAIKKSHETIIAARVPSTDVGRVRANSLLEVLNTVEERWWTEFQRFQASCKENHE